ncbi:MAG: carboxypeptidase-like regulatory domain-containing protein [Vicinamibacterales bacterium]
MAIVLCVLGVTRGAFAQESVNQASISGRVVDQQGMIVPGARVVARQTETNLVVEATSDGEGRFRFPYLKLGPDQLTVSLQGFNDAKRTLTLSIGSALTCRSSSTWRPSAASTWSAACR